VTDIDNRVSRLERAVFGHRDTRCKRTASGDAMHVVGCTCDDAEGPSARNMLESGYTQSVAFNDDARSRSSFWRALAYEVGDENADRICRAVDGACFAYNIAAHRVRKVGGP